MASQGFIPHITLEHRDTHEQVDYTGVSGLGALTIHYAKTRGVDEDAPVPEPVYEQTCVHLDGDEWFLRLPLAPEPGSYWRHFKGSTVQVLDVARHTETLEPLVVYRVGPTGDIWVRPLLMFIEHVEPDVPRFYPMAGRFRR